MVVSPEPEGPTTRPTCQAVPSTGRSTSHSWRIVACSGPRTGPGPARPGSWPPRATRSEREHAALEPLPGQPVVDLALVALVPALDEDLELLRRQDRGRLLLPLARPVAGFLGQVLEHADDGGAPRPDLLQER